MQWLAPMTAIYAAAAAVPLLVLLYFLKLKRRDQIISSTFLWRRAVQDLQVNAPFQRIRWSVLLLLQLLALAAILLALAQPVWLSSGGTAKRYVLLIDRSASMNATESGRSRLDTAKDQARTVVDSLRAGGLLSLRNEADRAMVVAFDTHPHVMCNFTSDKRQLKAAIEAIRPSDGRSCLSEAITVSCAFAQTSAEQADTVSMGPPAQVELFSDGRITDLEKIVAAPVELNYHCVGSQADNVAVVSLQARRSYERSEEVSVFAGLVNYGQDEADCDLQLSVDGNVRAVRPVTVPPASADGKPGSVSASYSLTHATSGVIELRQLRDDCLESDNAAWAILPPPKKLKVLLVTRGNLAVVPALRACPLERLDIKTPAEFEEMDHAAMSVEPHYDLIVLDNFVPSVLPKSRYLVFGRIPPSIGVSVTGDLTNQMIADWKSRHLVLRHVDLQNLFASRCRCMKLPRDAEILSESKDSPVMAIVRRDGSVFLLVSFDPMDTNWPFEPGFVMFCQNATAFLGMDAAQDSRSHRSVGQAIYIEGLPPAADATVHAPGGPSINTKCDAQGTLRYPDTARAGVYTVELGGDRAEHFAVNLLDAQESRIEPTSQITFSGKTIQAESSPPGPSNVELWPYLVALALALACVEWFVYNSKARL